MAHERVGIAERPLSGFDASRIRTAAVASAVNGGKAVAMAKKQSPAKKQTIAQLTEGVHKTQKQTSTEVGGLLWLKDVTEHDYPAAANYLGLVADGQTVDDLVKKLKAAPIEMHRANDVLRAARLELLPLGDPSVKRDLSKVLTGNRWSPVLVVRGDVLRDTPLTVADGYHRICASFHLSEDTYIPCKIVDLPERR